MLKAIVCTFLGVAFLLNSAGCAAMFHGTSQQISIRSNVSDADLFVNEQYVGKGSGAVTTFKKNQDYTIAVKRSGCYPTMVPASKSFDAITLLGVLIDFGIISVLVVDGAATGAWSQFDQTYYVIDPECPQTPVPATMAPYAPTTYAPPPATPVEAPTTVPVPPTVTSAAVSGPR